MTGSLLQTQPTFSPSDEKIQQWIRRFVWKIAIATLLLMAVGSATRVMNAGLACPDWPLCYGQLLPSQQMNLQVFLEWFHRLDASLIGISTAALVGLCWWFRKALPNWVPIATTISLGLIFLQALLGGLTVTELLRFDIVTAHLGTALLFLGSLITIGCGLSPYQSSGSAGKLAIAGATSTFLVFGQSLLGGLVASQWAVHQCLSLTQFCRVTNSHIVGVIPTTLSILLLLFFTRQTQMLNPVLRRLSWLAMGLLLEQITLGIATFRLHLQVEPLTVAHHTLGAALFSTLLALTIFALRDRSQYQS